MSRDHIHTRPVDDIVEFNSVDYEEELTIPFYLLGDTMYCGLYIKATSGTVYAKYTVIDSGGNTASKESDPITDTDWVKLTGDDMIQVDCSALTEGEASLLLELKGIGEFKDNHSCQE